MAEETTATAQEAPEAPEEGKQDEQHVPYERFAQVNRKAKEAAEQNKTLAKQLSELKAAMEERESAGLPELEKERRRAEQLEKRAAEAEQRADEATKAVERSRRERWVVAAAQSQGFADPSDAAAFVNLDELDDESAAERAVKQLAKQKRHLLKAEEPPLPGRVLQNGQAVKPGQAQDPRIVEAEMLANGLKQFLASKQ